MRELVLNHASLSSPDRHTATDWLTEVARGIAVLVNQRITRSQLRTIKPCGAIVCSDGYTLVDITGELRRRGNRDEFLSFSRLLANAPLLTDDLREDIRDRFLRCEAVILPPPDGEPLTLAAITDWITISFPSQTAWDKGDLTVDFWELLPNDTYQKTSEAVDNLSRTVHAGTIAHRHSNEARRAIQRGPDLWDLRHAAFPNLHFGPDVEDNVKEVNSMHVGAIVGKLAAIDRLAATWLETPGPPPPVSINITNESESVHNNQALRNARIFRSSFGGSQLFMWHARFGNSGRIHFRYIDDTRQIEIGYIGPHLPL